MKNRLMPFVKMHGLGNDFIILDARHVPFILSRTIIRSIASRHTSIGCDQVIVVMSSHCADAFLRIYNADGSETSACGNATRCVSAILMQEKKRESITLETYSGFLYSTRHKGNLVTVDMGLAWLDWQDIPLAVKLDTLNLPFSAGKLISATAVSMGNPHIVFFISSFEKVDLVAFCSYIERYILFPVYTNIGVVSLSKTGQLRLRVWERGVGVTRACGTNACASVVAAIRRNLITTRQLEIVLDGGVLSVTYCLDGRLMMTGPTKISFIGFLSRDLSEHLYQSARTN